MWIPWTKTIRILTRSTWKHRVLHNTCTMHGRDIKTRYIGSTSKFYQTRSNAIILYDTLPAYCIPKVVRMETGEVIYEKEYASPRPPPKISLKHDWMKELCSKVAQRPDGQVVGQGDGNKIENHPHRQDLQADLQQNNAFNPFSEKSKKMIKYMGNVELFELCETIPKVQCKECLLYWNQGIV